MVKSPELFASLRSAKGASDGEPLALSGYALVI